MKTISAKPSQIERKWYVIDARDLVLGRMAAVVARILRGKNKPLYTPNIDCGDYVVIINADKVRLTGRKEEKKKYYWHTEHPGGIRHLTARQIREGKNPTRLVTKAVGRMLPRSPLGREQMRKLKVYTGETHPHEGQNPEPLDVGAMNAKNRRNA